MKYLKIEYNNNLYQFEGKDKLELINSINERKNTFDVSKVKILTSNVFKIKLGKNLEIEKIFNS
jgi:hypothetical protein